jgi:hypothetical protein
MTQPTHTESLLQMPNGPHPFRTEHGDVGSIERHVGEHGEATFKVLLSERSSADALPPMVECHVDGDDGSHWHFCIAKAVLGGLRLGAPVLLHAQALVAGQQVELVHGKHPHWGHPR